MPNEHFDSLMFAYANYSVNSSQSERIKNVLKIIEEKNTADRNNEKIIYTTIVRSFRGLKIRLTLIKRFCGN